MTQTLRIFLCAITAALVGLTAACAPTEERRATGQVIDDTSINARVKTALIKADNVNASAINVNTYRGEVVLSGYVESEAMIQRAGAVARSVDGVRVLRNDLRLTPKR